MRMPPTMATRLTADPTSIEPSRRKRAARMPWWALRRDQKRKSGVPLNGGRVPRFNRSAGKNRSALFVVAVAHRVDVDEHAVLEPQAAHELVRPQVVDPHLDGNLDEPVADDDALPADPHRGLAKNGRLLIDLGGRAALGDDFGARVAFTHELRSATEGRVGGYGGCEGETQGEQCLFAHDVASYP